MRFRRKPIEVHARKIKVAQEIVLISGLKIDVKPGDWLVNEKWLYSDKLFRRWFEPIDEEASRAIKIPRIPVRPDELYFYTFAERVQITVFLLVVISLVVYAICKTYE